MLEARAWGNQAMQSRHWPIVAMFTVSRPLLSVRAKGFPRNREPNPPAPEELAILGIVGRRITCHLIVSRAI